MRYAGSPHISDDVQACLHILKRTHFLASLFIIVFFSVQKALELDWYAPSEAVGVVMGHSDAFILGLA